MVSRISSHSRRVGLTSDLFAAREDGLTITQTQRWESSATALRYGARLKVRSGSAAGVIGELRK